jgi:hypothetical protein
LLNGSLFTRDFLTEGIRGTTAWSGTVRIRGDSGGSFARATTIPPLRSRRCSMSTSRGQHALRDTQGRFTNNTCYFLPSGDPWLGCVLNAPIGWWFSWRRAQYGKDEALRYFTSFVEDYPVPTGQDILGEIDYLQKRKELIRNAVRSIHDWLYHELAMKKIVRALAGPHDLDADGFATAVRGALPKSIKLSSAEIGRIKQEYADTLIPAREAAADIVARERKLSDLVNAAYGLTPEEVALMWRTAPPRMPLDPAEELRRLALPS